MRKGIASLCKVMGNSYHIKTESFNFLLEIDIVRTYKFLDKFGCPDVLGVRCPNDAHCPDPLVCITQWLYCQRLKFEVLKNSGGYLCYFKFVHSSTQTKQIHFCRIFI